MEILYIWAAACIKGCPLVKGYTMPYIILYMIYPFTACPLANPIASLPRTQQSENAAGVISILVNISEIFLQIYDCYLQYVYR